ncbi:hypothetical protein MMC14_002691 [Varicellaria rhodocarpa]|nr:hypothetical protein [Varicellaria rhodocarpa]
MKITVLHSLIFGGPPHAPDEADTREVGFYSSIDMFDGLTDNPSHEVVGFVLHAVDINIATTNWEEDRVDPLNADDIPQFF